MSGEYIWKYTHNAYDFNVFGATPITFPIEWHNSKIPGYAIQASVPNFHGFTGLCGDVAAWTRVSSRPLSAASAPPPPPGVFRIDHDENFNQTTHLQYQPWKRGPWLGFNWRYDSGLVAGPMPGRMAIAPTVPRQRTRSGRVTPYRRPAVPGRAVLRQRPCNAHHADQRQLPCARHRSSVPHCFRSPRAGTENDDHNPPRVAPRNLFDLRLAMTTCSTRASATSGARALPSLT